MNNPGDWVPQLNADGGMVYLVAGLEVAPSTGTVHWQGYVRFSGRKRMASAKAALGRDDAHFEVAKGNEQQNREYCTKDHTNIQEFGDYDATAGAQGHRTDLSEIATKLKAGATLTAIANEYPADYVRYHAGIQALQERVAPVPPTRREVDVLVLWGPTGTGKTYRIRTGFAPQEIYLVQPGRGPWDQYQDQRCVFFDEFDYMQWPITEMNRYLHEWTEPLNCRYRNKFAVWTRVAICANSSPMEWYLNTPRPLREAFLRRIRNNVMRVDSRDEPPFPDPDFTDHETDTQPQS